MEPQGKTGKDTARGAGPGWVDAGWEPLAPRVARCRLPAVDATTGVVVGTDGLLVVDTGGTVGEGARIAGALRAVTGREATHVVLTHAHWDHCLGTPAFGGAEVCGQRKITARLGDRRALAHDARRYGVDADEARQAASAVVLPTRLVDVTETLDLGGVTVTLLHPGPAHTDHDLAAVVTVRGEPRPIVFCGDLVEESGPPQAGPDAVAEGWPCALDRLLEAGGGSALYVPGHGAVVDARFVSAQRAALTGRTTQ